MRKILKSVALLYHTLRILCFYFQFLFHSYFSQCSLTYRFLLHFSYLEFNSFFTFGFPTSSMRTTSKKKMKEKNVLSYRVRKFILFLLYENTLDVNVCIHTGIREGTGKEIFFPSFPIRISKMCLTLRDCSPTFEKESNPTNLRYELLHFFPP